MSVRAFELLLGPACFCAGLLLALFSKAAARKAIEQRRRRVEIYRRLIERASTEVFNRIFFVLRGLFFAAFGVLTVPGKVIK